MTWHPPFKMEIFLTSYFYIYTNPYFRNLEFLCAQSQKTETKSKTFKYWMKHFIGRSRLVSTIHVFAYCTVLGLLFSSFSTFYFFVSVWSAVTSNTSLSYIKNNFLLCLITNEPWDINMCKSIFGVLQSPLWFGLVEKSQLWWLFNVQSIKNSLKMRRNCVNVTHKCEDDVLPRF